MRRNSVKALRVGAVKAGGRFGGPSQSTAIDQRWRHIAPDDTADLDLPKELLQSCAKLARAREPKSVDVGECREQTLRPQGSDNRIQYPFLDIGRHVSPGQTADNVFCLLPTVLCQVFFDFLGAIVMDRQTGKS